MVEFVSQGWFGGDMHAAYLLYLMFGFRRHMIRPFPSTIAKRLILVHVSLCRIAETCRVRELS